MSGDLGLKTSVLECGREVIRMLSLVLDLAVSLSVCLGL